MLAGRGAPGTRGGSPGSGGAAAGGGHHPERRRCGVAAEAFAEVCLRRLVRANDALHHGGESVIGNEGDAIGEAPRAKRAERGIAWTATSALFIRCHPAGQFLPLLTMGALGFALRVQRALLRRGKVFRFLRLISLRPRLRFGRTHIGRKKKAPLPGGEGHFEVSPKAAATDGGRIYGSGRGIQHIRNPRTLAKACFAK